jgi:hypothetical protein
LAAGGAANALPVTPASDDTASATATTILRPTNCTIGFSWVGYTNQRHNMGGPQRGGFFPPAALILPFRKL